MTAVPNVLVPLGLPGAQWYAIQTRYRFERRVTVQLQHKGLRTFLPLLKEFHNWSDRLQPVFIPLFSGYAFVHLDQTAGLRMDVLQTEGVIGFIAIGGIAIPIPPKQIEDLQMLLSRKTPCALHAFLKVGQAVRIRGGSLDGIEGILERSGNKNLVISLAAIQRSIAITIEGYELELI
jgi:transcription antitermination factor NusG